MVGMFKGFESRALIYICLLWIKESFKSMAMHISVKEIAYLYKLTVIMAIQRNFYSELSLFVRIIPVVF